MLLDLLYLSRSLRRSRASASAAILTLSLTIGALGAIVAVVDAVVLTPPPFANADALVMLGEVPVDQPTASPRGVSYATFTAWRDRGASLASFAAMDGTNLTLTDLGAAERLSANDVTPELLPLLGVTPARGRTFSQDDLGQPVAIVSHAFWRAKLAADPNVIGRTITLGGTPHTIVGVLPDRFSFEFNDSAIWRPLPLSPAQAARTGYRVIVIARLSDRMSPSSLATALDDVSRASSPPARVAATRIATAIAGEATRTLGLLSAAAGLALLIAFINLCGLLMVRALDRQRELALRSALGAGRGEIVRQLLLEVAVIVAGGLVGGLLLAAWLTPVAARLSLQQFGALANREVTVSWRVIAIVSTVAIVGAGLCGLLAAWQAARPNVVDVLRRGSTPPAHELAMRRIFVAGEVALAFVLLLSMALLGRTLMAVLNTSPGFEARGVLALPVSLPRAVYPSRESVVSFYSALQQALQERLGARAVAVVDELPLTHDRGRSLVSVNPSDSRQEVVVRTVSPAYFEVMRIPLVAGRTFTPEDNGGPPLRIVISQPLAERLFPGAPPIGRQVRLGKTQIGEIVGVVGQVKLRALDEAPLPTVYLSGLQAPSNTSLIVVRSDRPNADVFATVREEVARLDRNVPVYGARPMPDVILASSGLPVRRVLRTAFAAFAVLALVLSAIGLFGVAAHDVARRRAELAIRVALGADRVHLLGATLGRGAVMVAAGLGAGAILSIWAVRALRGVIVMSGASDLSTIGATVAVLVVTGLGAVLPAALRAARTDPMSALRSE